MTFSIVGLDPDTGFLGVAVSTARLAVGNRVSFVKAGVGAIATQANTNVELGYEGIRLLEQGATAEQALRQVLLADDGREERQIAIIDINNGKAAFTGSKTESYNAHIIGANCVAVGNILSDGQTLKAMVDVFEATGGSLGDKLMQALAAGDRAGGDQRGKVSAALLVAAHTEHPYIDLRVDMSGQPVEDLVKLYYAYKEAFHLA